MILELWMEFQTDIVQAKTESFGVLSDQPSKSRLLVRNRKEGGGLQAGAGVMGGCTDHPSDWGRLQHGDRPHLGAPI